mmetsp:Transcript_22364/g.69907  ORF Transcript_22364/g.69907 Transcript_22364/m.69907 type:complete len:297 (+) Transcript_22364:140-1030(+)
MSSAHHAHRALHCLANFQVFAAVHAPSGHFCATPCYALLHSLVGGEGGRQVFGGVPILVPLRSRWCGGDCRCGRRATLAAAARAVRPVLLAQRLEVVHMLPECHLHFGELLGDHRGRDEDGEGARVEEVGVAVHLLRGEEEHAQERGGEANLGAAEVHAEGPVAARGDVSDDARVENLLEVDREQCHEGAHREELDILRVLDWLGSVGVDGLDGNAHADESDTQHPVGEIPCEAAQRVAASGVVVPHKWVGAVVEVHDGHEQGKARAEGRCALACVLPAPACTQTVGVGEHGYVRL